MTGPLQPPPDALIHPDWLRPDWDLPHVRAFMTTRSGGYSQGIHAGMNVGLAVQDDAGTVARNRALVSAALGATAVFGPQVHGIQVLRLRAEHGLPGTLLPEVDAYVSTLPGLGVAIQVADCLPVLFAAPRGVAGAHAGWRGLSAGVLENTVAELCAAADCQPRDLQAWMGACIGKDAFEVGADVLEAFGAAERDFFIYRPNAAGQPRWRADLVGMARRRLQALGLESINGGHWCTLSDSSRFFSYRQSRLGGRMVAAIALV